MTTPPVSAGLVFWLRMNYRLWPHIPETAADVRLRVHSCRSETQGDRQQWVVNRLLQRSTMTSAIREMIPITQEADVQVVHCNRLESAMSGLRRLTEHR